MASRTWLINSRGIARKVKNTTKLSEHELKDWGANANKECPNCQHIIDNSDVTCEWPGLPAGVKFDPSDIELLEHLSGKIGLSKPHIFIDEFIPTLEANEGICYTHPENLPGVKKDGSSVHFFHKTSNAYTCGHRKRRKIHGSHSLVEENVRWHKTGKTKAVIENGVQKGCKKIMVLYKSTKKGSKPKKSNWVMHQYHLGCEEDEKEGEFVVSKISYQQQLKLVDEKSDDNIPDHDEEDAVNLRWSPKTPKTDTPQPPSRGKHRYDELDEEIKQEYSPGKDAGAILKTHAARYCDANVKKEKVEPTWWAGESQAVHDEPRGNNINDPLLCHEILDSNACQGELGLDHFPFFSEFGGSESAKLERAAHQAGGLSDLDNLELGTPPDFQLSDLQFGSQDSIFGWLDRL